jgi:antitoxin (DNA-binding transcriptional repressor) of toxin-antitoxin stability system
MQNVNIRDLMHNFSRYLKDVKEGECITILERNKPVADIVPHNPNVRYPGWKRAIRKRSISGESFSETVVRNREQEQ